MQRAQHDRARSTSHLQYVRRVKGLGAFVESLIDKAFLSSVLIAPAAAFAALRAFRSGGTSRALAWGTIAAGAGIGAYARFVAPFRLQVRHLHLPPAQGKPLGMRVCFFSDLHLGRYKGRAWAERLVRLVNAQDPDLVLIGGDFVGDVEPALLQSMLEPLRYLRAPLGVFAVLGNHDCGMPGTDYSETLLTLLPRLDVRVLRNECVQLSALHVIGVDELWAERDDFVAAIAHCAAHQPAERVLVFCHNPDLMLLIEHGHPELRGSDWVFLFGHTHHGQIHLPLLTRLGLPVASPYYRGLYRTPFGAVYVSAGVGEHTTPTRFNAPPEIALVTL
ncbi:MAG: metallophosphoesterase [Thermoflexales bacterium]|nr:metallophosphoesterase [Thermoflexales bacterium]